jgi:hypothetical protein
VIWHDVEHGSDEWFGLRLGKPTASNFPVFMANEGKAFGEPAQREALKLALEVVTGKRSAHSFSNEHMERGNAQEPVARALYGRTYFAEIGKGGFFDCGEYGASPDGLVGDGGLIEVKSVIASTHYANLRRGTFDPAYRWQLVGELECTGRAWVDFVSYCSDFPEDAQLFVHRVHASEVQDEVARLRARRAEFLQLVKMTINTIDPDRCWPKAA